MDRNVCAIRDRSCCLPFNGRALLGIALTIICSSAFARLPSFNPAALQSSLRPDPTLGATFGVLLFVSLALALWIRRPPRWISVGWTVLLGLPVLLTLACVWLELAGIFFSRLTGEVFSVAIMPWSFAYAWMVYQDSTMLRDLLHAAWGALAAVSAVPLATLFFVMRLPARPQALHGESHWATRREIARARLLGTKGLVLGKYGRAFLFFNGELRGKNVLIAAPPGSGKSAGIMLPNCLTWTASLVALDIKGECYEFSATYRRNLGQEVYRLDFSARDGRTDQYNPFDYVSEDPALRIGDVEKIARYLCPDPQNADGFWAMGARDMFRAVALYLYDSGAPVNLGAIRDLLECDEGLRAFAKTLVKSVKAEVIQGITPRVLSDFANIATRSENTHSGIYDQLMMALAPLTNPLIRFATSGNSFHLTELRKRPISIYVVIARPDLPLLKPLVNLFIQQMVDANTVVEFGKDAAHRCEVLLAMDEFAQIGRVDAIFHGITYFRSFGLRLLAIVQSPSQLKEAYSVEGAETFEQSFDCRVYFTPAASDLRTAETLSRLLGYNTVSGTSRSMRQGAARAARSETRTDKPRALLLPQEVLRLPAESEIILIGGAAPILARKIRVWKEPRFQRLVSRSLNRSRKQRRANTPGNVLKGRVRNLHKSL